MSNYVSVLDKALADAEVAYADLRAIPSSDDLWTRWADAVHYAQRVLDISLGISARKPRPVTAPR